MILNYLVEEFLTGDKYRTAYHDGWAEIYKNPTAREMRDIANADNNDEDSIRLAVDANGNVYAWIYTILHEEMAKILNKNWLLRFEYNYPEKVMWLGSDSDEGDWEKHGSEDTLKKLSIAVPGLNAIKYSNIDGNAWEK